MEKLRMGNGETAGIKAALVALSMFAPVKADAEQARVYGVEKMAAAPERSEEFFGDLAAVATFVSMPNGVLYLDKEGKPLAIVPAQIIDDINPGVGFSDVGRVTEGYDKKWKEAAKAVAARVEPAVTEVGSEPKYNWLEIQRAVSNPAEAMHTEEIHSISDVVFYFGNKETRGGDGLSRIDYVLERIEFSDTMPTELQTALKEVVVGVPAQESRFNDAVKSRVGASGIFQFMPATVAGLGGYEQYVEYNSEGKPTGLSSIPLTVQVEMAGKHFSNIYAELNQHLDTDLLSQLNILYASEKDFYIYFMTPLIINSYNAGSKRVAEAVKQFFTPERIAEIAAAYPQGAGYDVYEQMVDFAKDSNEGLLGGFQDDSSTYTEHVYGHALVIKRDYPAYKAKQNPDS